MVDETEVPQFQMSAAELQITSTNVSTGDIANIPLPNELPLQRKTSAFVAPGLQSSAVDALIHQNDDLMARLTIQIRRSSDLEIRSRQLIERNQVLNSRIETLTDELTVSQEKLRSHENEIERSRQHIMTLDDHRTKLESVSAENARLREAFDVSEKNRSTIEKESREQTHAFTNLEQMYQHAQEETKGLRKRLGDVEEQLKNSVEQFQRDLGSLMERHDSIQRQNSEDYRRALKDLEETQRRLSQTTATLDRLKEDRIILENRALMVERRRDEMEKKFNLEIEDLQKLLIEARAESQSRRIQVETLSQALGQAETRSARAETDRNKFKEQSDAMHMLYDQLLKETERVRNQSEASEKLNQHLSEVIASQRKENAKLKFDGEKSTSLPGELMSERGDLGDLL